MASAQPTPSDGRRYLLPALSVSVVRGMAAGLFVLGLAVPWLAPQTGIAALQPPTLPPPPSEPPPQTRPKLVRLPGGTFLMGSPEGVGSDDEHPQREVTVGAFWMCQTEVTQGQWRELMGDNPSYADYGIGDDYPVNGVSWLDALRYLNTASEHEGLAPCYSIADEDAEWHRDCNGYRLPTEAEWEYATRAGTTTAWSFGENEEDVALYAEVNSDALAPVASLQPNPWRLYDVHGNAREWVWDWYAHSYQGGSTNRPIGVHKGTSRVLRGGSFYYGPTLARSAYRGGVLPVYRGWNDGFRCARGPHLQPLLP